MSALPTDAISIKADMLAALEAAWATEVSGAAREAWSRYARTFHWDTAASLTESLLLQHAE